MIYIASDHAGFILKEKLIEYFQLHNLSYCDLGPTEYTEDDDYTTYARLVCQKISEGNLGVLICGSGQGMCIAANRYSHIRAVQAWSIYSAQLARQDDNANIVCLSARADMLDEPIEIVDAFFHTEYEPNENKERRLKTLEIIQEN